MLKGQQGCCAKRNSDAQKELKMRMKPGFIFLILLLGCCSASFGAVRMPAIFSDNMVLQRDTPIPVWGWAEPGKKIAVALGTNSVTATADDDGKWKVKLPAQPAGGPFSLSVSGSGSISYKNIMLGDVWVCAGQSNMEMGLWRCANPKEEIAKSDYPKFRIYIVNRELLSSELRDDASGKWEVCGPKTSAWLSGVGYAFGRELLKDLNVPIGLIHACRGSTPITSWISMKALHSFPEASKLYKGYEKLDPKLSAPFDKWKETLADWKKNRDSGRDPGPYPERPVFDTDMYYPGSVFNGQIAPLTPFAVKGIIWYHGEADIGNYNIYSKLFLLLIKDWRTRWGRDDLPFLFVQLANFGNPSSLTGDSSWANMREAQAQALSLPNTGMAVAIDAGAVDYFPPDKKAVGERLALAARGVAYGEKVEYSGPVFERMKVNGNSAEISFQHAGKGLKIGDGKQEALKGFAVAGSDGKFYGADAVIKGNTVVVSSSKVSGPAAVRYGWADNPECNLYNSEGLPAVPFRSDSK